MEKRVKLILQYDMGFYPEEYCTKDLHDWEDAFYQSDVVIGDIDIIGVKIEEQVTDGEDGL